MDIYISEATRRNWARLGTNQNEKLVARANKTKSTKRFIPQERCPNKSVEEWINTLISMSLTQHWEISSVLRSVIEKLFIENHITTKSSYRKFNEEYRDFSLIPEILNLNIPQAFDLLGTIYQAYLTEGEKNIRGSYFTPENIIKDMVGQYNFSENQRFLDPCCGSGAFLISINTNNPNSLYGIDKDPIAVMLSKANLIIKFRDKDFYPNVYLSDFISNDIFNENFLVSLGKFDMVATNPPWGGQISHNEVQNFCGETASFFFIKSSEFLTDNGTIVFLVPVSLLNVKSHQKFRQFILRNLHLKRIQIYKDLFSGVTTKYASIEADKHGKSNFVNYILNGTEQKVSTETFFKTNSLTFTPMQDLDSQILKKVRNKGNLSLKESIWALGIVTGDNKSKLHDVKGDQEEQIYTGKEIQAFSLLPPRKYILFDRTNLQQVAREEYYRAEEKLVYKFISKKLTFAYDNSKALFLNSANILIPNIPGMSIKTVLSFLNSSLFQFLYIRLFDEVKILKGNLLELPFPVLTAEEDKKFSEYVDKILNGNKQVFNELEREINNFYGLNEIESQHIQEVINGRFN